VQGHAESNTTQFIVGENVLNKNKGSLLEITKHSGGKSGSTSSFVIVLNITCQREGLFSKLDFYRHITGVLLLLCYRIVLFISYLYWQVS